MGKMREARKLITPRAVLDVVDFEEYGAHKDIYANTHTAIEIEAGNRKLVLPYKKKGSTGPGLYDEGIFCFIQEPESDDDRYDIAKVINLSKSQNINELMEKNKMIKDMEDEILTNSDNLFVPNIGPDDTPEMIGLKEAVISKGIDIDNYEDRFGPNFPNDKRLFKSGKITMDKLKRVANNLDIGVKITFYDKSSNVPNPMDKVIEKVITTGGNYNND